MRYFPNAAPGDRLDYAFDLTPELLDGEAVTDATITADRSGLTIETPLIASPRAIVWIADGTAQTSYLLTCVALTSQGRAIVGQARLFVGAPGLDDSAAVGPIA